MKKSTESIIKKPAFSIPLDRIIFYTAAFLVLAVPLFILPGITEYGYGKTIVMIVSVSVLTVLWTLDTWRKSAWRIRLPWIFVGFAGLVIASLLSLIHAMSGLVVLQSLALLVVFAQFGLLLSQVVRDARDVGLLIGALLLAALASGLYGLLQYLGMARGAGGSGIGNIISFMGNRNYLGGFLIYMLFPSMLLVIRPRFRVLRFLAIPAICFLFAMAFLLQQAAVPVAAALAFLTLLVGLAVFRPGEALRARRIELLTLILTLVLTFLVATPSGPLNSVVGLSEDGQSWIARMWERNAGGVRSWDWWVGWEMFKAHPVTGVGLGNYKLAFIPYKAQFLSTPRGADFDFYIARAAQAHNDYVQVLAELGILGTLSLAGLLVLLPISLWIRLRRSTCAWKRLDMLLLIAGLVTFLAHAFVSFPAHLPASALVAITLVGILFSQVYGERGVFRIHLPRIPATVLGITLTLFSVVVSVIALRDLHANVLMGQGVAQMQRGNNAVAVATLEKSLRYDFCARQTYSYLASAYLALGQPDRSLEALEVCLTRFTDESTYVNYADLAATQDRLDEARETATLLLNSHPSRAAASKASYILALVEAKEGDLEAAASRLYRVIEEDPSFQVGYILLASIVAAQGDTEEARTLLQRALAVIERELRSAENKLSSATEMPLAEYGSLRSSISRLHSERDLVRERLDRLP